MKHRKTKPAVGLAKLMRATKPPDPPAPAQSATRTDRYWKVRA